MSWFNGQIYTKEEIEDIGALELPCNHQVGDEVAVHIWSEGNTNKLTIIGRLVGVKISNMHCITYDIAVKIEGQDLWVTMRDIRGHVTKKGEYSDPSGGLVDAEEIKKHLAKDVKTTTLLKLV